MSLLRLLTTGRSLVGLQDRGHKYQVPRQSVMPTFVSKRNPFRRTARPEQGNLSVMDEPVSTAKPSAEPGGVMQRGPVAVSSESGKAAEASTRAPGPVLSKPVSTAAVGAVPGGWPSKVWRLLGLRGAGGRNSHGRATKPLVQGELCLDNVRVVRNDLSDSDLELVAATDVSADAPAGQAQPAAPARPAWSRLGARLFGAAKT